MKFWQQQFAASREESVPSAWWTGLLVLALVVVLLASWLWFYGENEEEAEAVVAGEIVLAGDADADRILDEEEVRLGLAPDTKDTDGDGLLDADELQVYQTDPRVADSDGDGLSDGAEVKSGRNPLGEGLLQSLP